MSERGRNDPRRGKSLERRILDLYSDLPRGERRLADVILETPGDLAKYSATELSQRAQVSNATAARLFKRLGYQSYIEARRAAREMAETDRAMPPIVSLADIPGLSVELSFHLTSDLQNLIRTIAALPQDLLRASIDALAQAEKIWVVGLGDNYPLAHFARALLIRIKPDIRMIPIGGFPVPEEFASITPQDTMLAFGFRRRTRSLLRIMQSAKDAGARIIMVSDTTASTTADIATITLRCRSRGASLFDSVVAPVSLMTYICSAIAATIGQTAVERLHRIESLHDAWGDIES
jgi:DNA-binding MurR/RpiR family transcriptional regulator